MRLPKISGSGNTGFTVIELTVVIAIFVILLGLSFFINIDFYKSRMLISERDALVSILRRARAFALTNVNESSHGVFIGDNFIVFQGLSYATRDPIWDEIYPKNAAIAVTGVQEVVFDALTADTSVSGTIALDYDQHSASVLINQGGRISK